MEEIKAYKCGYCGKLYQRKHACRRHEDNDCLKNPKIRPICFDCKFMQRSEETEDVPYPAETVDGWSGTAYLKFERTTCHRTGAKKINVLTDAAMEWLKKHRMPWQVVGETPAETLHLARLMADFAADTLLRHDDNIEDTEVEHNEAQNVAKELFNACTVSLRRESKLGYDTIFANLRNIEVDEIAHIMVIYARLNRLDRETIRAGKKAVI
jgi:hypothetical protein